MSGGQPNSRTTEYDFAFSGEPQFPRGIDLTAPIYAQAADFPAPRVNRVSGRTADLLKD
jgi:hypothetical protein